LYIMHMEVKVAECEGERTGRQSVLRESMGST